MFTGIIESKGIIEVVETRGTNKTFTVKSAISNQLKVDQSVSHNGVCLTVEAVTNDTHTLTAIDETLRKTNLNNWVAGTVVNLERCVSLNGRLDGHLVQGHVDTIGICQTITDKEGSREFTFSFPETFGSLIIEKGSISLDGISLTIFNVGRNSFTVAIIPYTLNNTSLQNLKAGDSVNLEFDLIGKYIQRDLHLKQGR